jgi:hypothetical protein
MPSMRGIFAGAACLLLLSGIVIFFGVPVAAQAVKAALVRDIDNADRQPVTMVFNYNLPNNVSQAGCGSAGPSYTVPTGKRLVIDYINLTALMDVDTQTPGFSLTGMVSAYYPLRVGRAAFGGAAFGSSQPVKVYYEADRVVGGCAFRDSAVSGAAIRADVTGHLVDLQ